MANEVNYLYEPEGSELHWDGVKPKPKPIEASLSGTSMVHPADRVGMQGTSAADASAYREPPPPAAEPRTRPPTYEELKAAADKMMHDQMNQHAAMLSGGPSTGDRDDAGGKIPAWLTQEMRKQGQ